MFVVLRKDGVHSYSTRSVTKEGFVTYHSYSTRGVHSYSTRSVTKEGFVVRGVHSYSTRSVTKEGFVVPFLFYSFSD